MLGADNVDGNIHEICYHCFKLLKEMSYHSAEDKAYERNSEDAS